MSDENEGDAPMRELALEGPQKVTALLLSMGKPLADRIIRNFDETEIRILAKTASSLPTVPPEAIEALISELEQGLETSDVLVGSSSEAQLLLTGVVSDEQVSEIMSELDGTAHDRVWGKLLGVADDKLATFISGEQPQVAAFILSKLPVPKASAVMEKVDLALGADLGRRLLALKPIRDEAARMVAERIGQELLGEVVAGSAVNRHAQLGAILNQLGRTQVTEILTAIEEVQPDDARKVKEHVFGFEDLISMPDPDRVRLLEEVPAERLVLALLECELGLRECVLAALSPRSRRLVEAELANPPKATPKSIQEARREIAALALSMAERQMIVLRHPTDGQAPS